MNKPFLFLAVLSSQFFYSCSSQSEADRIQSSIDSLETASQVDSMVNYTMEKANENFWSDRYNTSVKNSPVEVLSVKIFDDPETYSLDWKNIKIVFKNNTNKTATAIRFEWYDIKNSFDEPIDIALSRGGYTEEKLGSNKTSYGTWDLRDERPRTAKAYVSKVMFSDGTYWEL